MSKVKTHRTLRITTQYAAFANLEPEQRDSLEGQSWIASEWPAIRELGIFRQPRAAREDLSRSALHGQAKIGFRTRPLKI